MPGGEGVIHEEECRVVLVRSPRVTRSAGVLLQEQKVVLRRRNTDLASTHRFCCAEGEPLSVLLRTVPEAVVAA